MGKTKNVVVSGENTSTKKDKYAVKKLEEQAAKAVVNKPKHGKNIVSAQNKIDKNRTYSLPEAITLVRETSFVKFDATVEMHTRIRKETFSAQVSLPHGTGKEKRVVFATDNTVSELEAGKINFDVLLATPEMMPKLVKFAKLLGPRGLMPNPKNGTIVKNEEAVKNFSTATITVKTEKTAPIIHLAVGKLSMSDKDIQDNIETLVTAINPKQVLSMHLSSTMGPSVKVAIN